MSKINFRVDSSNNFKNANTNLRKGEPTLSNTFPYELRIATSDGGWGDAISFKPVTNFTPDLSDIDISEGTITYDDQNLYIKTQIGWCHVPISAISNEVEQYEIPSEEDDSTSLRILSVYSPYQSSTNASPEQQIEENSYTDAPTTFVGRIITQSIVQDPYFTSNVQYSVGDSGVNNRSFDVVNLDYIRNTAGENFILQGVDSNDLIFNINTYPSGTSFISYPLPVPSSVYPYYADGSEEQANTRFRFRVVLESNSGEPLVIHAPTTYVFNGSSSRSNDLSYSKNNYLYHGGYHPFFSVDYSTYQVPLNQGLNVDGNDYNSREDLIWAKLNNFAPFSPYISLQTDQYSEYRKWVERMPEYDPSVAIPNFYPLSKVMASDGLNFASVEAGLSNNFYGITSGGSLYGWGENLSRQVYDLHLPLDKQSLHHPIPIQIFESGVKKISAGNGFALCLLDNGTVYVLGGPMSEGVDPSTFPLPPKFELSDTTFVDVSCYDKLGAMVDSEGKVWFVGHSHGGSDGRFDFRMGAESEPEENLVGYGTQLDLDAARISMGKHHMLVLKTDGSLVGYGDNKNNALGSDAAPLANGGFTKVFAKRMSTFQYEISGETEYTSLDFLSLLFAAGNDATAITDNGKVSLFGSMSDASYNGEILKGGLAMVSLSKCSDISRNTLALFENTNGELCVLGANCGWASYHRNSPTGSWASVINYNGYMLGSWSTYPQEREGGSYLTSNSSANFFETNHPKQIKQRGTVRNILSLGLPSEISAAPGTVGQGGVPTKPLIAMNENNFLALASRNQKISTSNIDTDETVVRGFSTYSKQDMSIYDNQSKIEGALSWGLLWSVIADNNANAAANRWGGFKPSKTN